MPLRLCKSLFVLNGKGYARHGQPCRPVFLRVMKPRKIGWFRQLVLPPQFLNIPKDRGFPYTIISFVILPNFAFLTDVMQALLLIPKDGQSSCPPAKGKRTGMASS